MNTMTTIWKLTLSQLLMYSRDRQSLFFALFFPIIMMLALGFMVGNSEVEPIDVSVVGKENEAEVFVEAFKSSPLLTIHEEQEAEAREALRKGDRDLILFSPADFDPKMLSTPLSLSILVNASEVQKNQQTLAILQSVLVDVERKLRNSEALFTLAVEDVEARAQRYVDFLIPGLMAFMVMQLAIAGSGFNIVEWKRKGILKRLFVTPLRPLDFIVGLILSRLVIIVVQITLLLVVAKLVFDISILGSWALFYLFIILGSILFLGLGFALGGIAKTQSAVAIFGNLLIFPQVFLAGVFFSLDTLPEWLRPIAQMLPLNFVSDALRQIANEGAGFTGLGFDIAGILVWTVIGIFLATWLFKWGEGAS